MSQFTSVYLPQSSPNDLTALLLEWNREAGRWVNRGEVIAMAETTKSVFDIEAPQAGYLYAHGMLAQNYGQGMRAWNAEMLIDGESVWYCGGESVETTPSLSGSRYVSAGKHTVLVRWSGEVGVRINQRTLFAQLVMR